MYPINGSCPLAQFATNTPDTSCTVGNSPVFAVNVTEEEHITKAVEFAKKNNIRLVIKSTGHDFLQRLESSSPYSFKAVTNHSLDLPATAVFPFGSRTTAAVSTFTMTSKSSTTVPSQIGRAVP